MFYILGLFIALGHGLLLAATIAIIPHYFKKKLALAFGVINALSAIIIVGLPVVTSIILERYSLIELFYLFVILHIISGILSFTFKPCLPIDLNSTYIERIKQSFGLEVLKKRKFLIWCIASSIGMFGYLMPILNIVRFILI